MFGESKQNGISEARALPLAMPSHKSYPNQPSLSHWSGNPTSLPVTNLQRPLRSASLAPTVPPRNHSCESDNWVDLEELYRWLQELEDPQLQPSCDDEKRRGKEQREREWKYTHCLVCVLHNAVLILLRYKWDLKMTNPVQDLWNKWIWNLFIFPTYYLK